MTDRQIFCDHRGDHRGNIPTGIPLTESSKAGGVGKNRDSRRISGEVRIATDYCDRPPCSLPPIRESLFIATSMDDHDEEKRTEQNEFVCIGHRLGCSVDQKTILKTMAVRGVEF